MATTTTTTGNRLFARSDHMVWNKLCWDASCTVGLQNKATLTSPARLSFVLKVPLPYLRPVPCDQMVQRTYSRDLKRKCCYWPFISLSQHQHDVLHFACCSQSCFVHVTVTNSQTLGSEFHLRSLPYVHLVDNWPSCWFLYFLCCSTMLSAIEI